jgi:exopolyphosphatase/guanosine-5'-triphosphate,3'-diphosphate pyrophosphatase
MNQGFDAVIDLGTNTFRLLIAEIRRGRIQTIYSENRITRLGEGFSGKIICPAAIERAIAALSSFQRTLTQHFVAHLSVVGTSAIRDAVNQKSFLLSVRELVGFDVEVLSGEEEARLTFLGANQILQNREGPMLMVDIGGGSTELIVAEGEVPHFMTSLPLGVVHLTEKYLRHDPPLLEECHAMQSEIARIISDAVPSFPSGKGLFAGTAGTLTTLAAIAQKMARYDVERINRYILLKEMIEEILKMILKTPIKDRLKIIGLEPGREEIIVAGTFILLAIMEVCHYDLVTVSDYGLREGVLVDRGRINNLLF